jgi:hypothetical protein
MGTMTERGPGRWRLQVAVDPDLVSSERRRLSRTVEGTRSEVKEALQRMVDQAGAGLYGGGRVTVGDLLEQFLESATLASTTYHDWGFLPARDRDAAAHLDGLLGYDPER